VEKGFWHDDLDYFWREINVLGRRGIPHAKSSKPSPSGPSQLGIGRLPCLGRRLRHGDPDKLAGGFDCLLCSLAQVFQFGSSRLPPWARSFDRRTQKNKNRLAKPFAISVRVNRDRAQYGRSTPELRYRKAWMLIQFARNYAILGDTSVFSWANADDKSSPNMHAVTKNLFMISPHDKGRPSPGGAT
jgi:hypothetical protein